MKEDRIREEKKNGNGKNSIKKDNQKNEEINEILEVSKPVNKNEWLCEGLDRYTKAVKSAIEKVPVPDNGVIDIKDIWINSSLPADLIIEIIEKKNIIENESIKKIVLNEKTIWTNE